jgi:hypothetical protein
VIYLVSVQVDHLVLLLVPFLLDENSFSVLRVLAYEAFCFDASLSQIFLSPLFPLFLYFYIYLRGRHARAAASVTRDGNSGTGT